MEAYEREQWKQLDERLAEAEKRLKATANLVQAADSQMRIDALIDADARLCILLQELAQTRKKTNERVDRLVASVQKLGRTAAW